MNIKNIISLQAYNLIERDENAILVDVRTPNEWQSVGSPYLQNRKILFLSWLSDSNLKFGNQLTFKIRDKMAPILFLCRSGIRSFEAAKFAVNIGYKNCYNIIDGFEGNIYDIGWKQNNLPWQI